MALSSLSSPVTDSSLCKKHRKERKKKLLLIILILFLSLSVKERKEETTHARKRMPFHTQSSSIRSSVHDRTDFIFDCSLGNVEDLIMNDIFHRKMRFFC